MDIHEHSDIRCSARSSSSKVIIRDPLDYVRQQLQRILEGITARESLRPELQCLYLNLERVANHEQGAYCAHPSCWQTKQLNYASDFEAHSNYHIEKDLVCPRCRHQFANALAIRQHLKKKEQRGSCPKTRKQLGRAKTIERRRDRNHRHNRTLSSESLQLISIPGPQRQLPPHTKVPDTAKSISFAINGDIDGLRYLFTEGFASPRDVSNSRGFSLMRWALYGGMHNYKTVQFLLSQGASVDEESYQHAWDFAYRARCSTIELEELKCITLNPPTTERDWVEEQQFPLIHKIVLGQSSKPLETELNDNPNAVHAIDAQGRTALDWATARAQVSNMRLLTARGSPVDTMDVSGRTTLLHAVDSHDDDALRIILEAGANPNPDMPKGLYRSSPLIAASFGGLVEMVKLLVGFGAKVDDHNPEGRTALQTVASIQNIECADILLTYGADLAYTTKNGHSPFMTAIMCNNHAVLQLFIDWCHNNRLDWPQLSPVTADFADAETMSILASSHRTPTGQRRICPQL